jgi:hypothetical protein
MEKYNIYKGINSKKKMLEKATTEKAYIQYMDEKGYRNFTCMEDWKTALDKLPYYNGKRFIYELILSSKPCKPYLDIERMVDRKPTIEETAEFIGGLKKDIMRVFERRYGIKITADTIKILDSSKKKETQYKISYHVVITTKNQILSGCLILGILT